MILFVIFLENRIGGFFCFSRSRNLDDKRHLIFVEYLRFLQKGKHCVVRRNEQSRTNGKKSKVYYLDFDGENRSIEASRPTVKECEHLPKSNYRRIFFSSKKKKKEEKETKSICNNRRRRLLLLETTFRGS